MTKYEYMGEEPAHSPYVVVGIDFNDNNRMIIMTGSKVFRTYEQAKDYADTCDSSWRARPFMVVEGYVHRGGEEE